MKDGSIRVGTELDTSGIEQDLKRLNDKLQNSSKETQSAVNKILNGKEMKGLDKQINTANNSLSKTKSKLAEVEKELLKIQAQTDKDLRFATTDEQAVSVLQLEEMQTKKLREQQALLNDEVKKYKKEIESANISKRKLVDVAKDKMQLGVFRDAGNSVNAFTESVNRGIKRLLKMGVAVYGIRTAYTILSRAATTYMNNNEEVRDSITGVWNALGELLGPVIEWITGLLLKLIGYLDVFVQALTGVSFIAKANAKALGKQTSAQEKLNKAQRQQAGFDEQNVLSDTSGSSSGGDVGSGLSSFGGIDMSGVELDPNVVEGIRNFGEICKDVFGWIKDNWEIVVIALAGITAGIIAFQIASLPISATVLLIVGAIALLIAIIVAVIVYWDEIKIVVGNVVDWIKDKWDKFCSWFGEIWDGIKQWFIDLWNGIKDLIDKFIQWFKDNWDTLILFLINPVAGLFKYLYENFDGFRNFIDGIVNKIKGFFSGLWDKIKTGASNTWTAIKNVFSSIPNWFKSKFTEAWQKVKDVFSTGGKIFDGIKDGIANVFKTVVNGIIGGINKCIAVPFNAINKMLNKIRNAEFLGIAPFKGMWSQDPLKVPEIPKLAKGGIVNNPGKGVPLIAGERGKEVILPLETNTEWMDDLVDKIGGNITIPIYLPNGKKMAEYVIDVASKKAFAKGV